MEAISENAPNYRWIYTYDYAPDSVWEPWRTGQGKPAWIDVEADAVARRVSSGLPAYILLTDSHYAYNGTWEDTVTSMSAVSRLVRLSGIIHLGDLSDGLLPAEQTRAIAARVMRDLHNVAEPVYSVPGNHDYNYFRSNPEVIYPDVPRYYADDEGQKLRMIFIDSFDPKEPVRYGFKDEGVDWLDAVLKGLPEGYLAIVFSHVTPLVRLQCWTDNIRNREKLITVLNQYADRILAFINGHSHCDLLFNDLHNGRFPIIAINCAKCECFMEHKPEGAVTPFRRLGDRTQECFDIMQPDTKNRTLRLIRFGAGSDRVVQGHRAMWI